MAYDVHLAGRVRELVGWLYVDGDARRIKRQIRGCAACYWVNAGDGVMVSTSVFSL